MIEAVVNSSTHRLFTMPYEISFNFSKPYNSYMYLSE